MEQGYGSAISAGVTHLAGGRSATDAHVQPTAPVLPWPRKTNIGHLTPVGPVHRDDILLVQSPELSNTTATSNGRAHHNTD